MITEWQNTFNPYGVRFTTHTTSTDITGLVREDWSTLEPAHFDPTVITKIRRPDLRKAWVLKPDQQKYIEWQIPPETSSSMTVSGQPDPKTTEEPLPDSFPGISISSQVKGPGPIENIQGFETKSYVITLLMSSLDPKSGKEVRRYEYREKVWLSQEINLLPFQADWGKEISIQTNQARRAIQDFQANKSKSWLKKDIFAAYHYEQSIFQLEQTKLYQALPGVPVRRVTVSVSLIPGKERSFKNQETAAAAQGQTTPIVGVNPLELGISAGLDLLFSGISSLRAHHREIPAWVLEIDPAFAEHGGAAEKIELQSLQNTPSAGLFDLPEKFKKVSHF